MPVKVVAPGDWEKTTGLDEKPGAGGKAETSGAGPKNIGSGPRAV